MEFDFKNPQVASLAQYWVDLQSDSGAPLWRAFDIADLPVAVWPRLMVIDVIDEPCRFRARLIGAYIIDAFGRDSTGRRFVNEEIPGIEGTDYLASLHEVADLKTPHYRFRRARFQMRDEYEFAEVLSLPFLDENGAVSMIVTGVDYVGFRERFMVRARD